MGRSTSSPALVRHHAMAAIYLGVALAAAMLAVVLATLWTERQAITRRAEQQEGNIALAIQGDIAQAITALDLSLRTAVRGMATPGLAALDASIRQRILFSEAAALEGSPVFIADETGTVRYRSREAMAGPPNIADRPYFLNHRDNPGLGLVISPPIRSRGDGKWILGVSRRISHPDGSFAGAALGRVELRFFDKLFDRLDIGRGDVINLVSTEGQLIARRPQQAGDIGRDMSDSQMFRHLATQPAGSFKTAASIDGVRRLYSYRKVDNLPFVVGVGVPVSEIYGGWQRKTAILGSVMLLLATLCLAAIRALRSELLRRERAEAATAASERRHAEALARLDAMFNNSPDLMAALRVAEDGRLCYEAVNPVWEAKTGVSGMTAIGRDPQDCLPPDLAAIILPLLRRCLRERRPVRFSFHINRQLQAQDWEGAVVPVIDADGQIRRLIKTGRDVSERNLLEASLRQAQRMEAVGQLTAGVAHDFNNLLQAIVSALEVIQSEPGLAAKGCKAASVIDGAVSRGSTLVHRLLAFARKQPLDPGTLQPAMVLTGIVPLLDSVLGERIRVQIDHHDDVWPVTADAAQLENCLVNLAINARDAMPAGGVIRLGLRNEDAEAARQAGLPPVGHVRFAVEDQGVGMDADTLARAVEPFFTTKPPGQGSGLGLSMVQGFARQSGGDVRLESQVGRGTTVSLWLPRSDRIAASAAPDRLARREMSDQALRVMLVDDEAAVLDTLALFVSQDGFNPIAVESGDGALRLLEAGERCDLLVTDQSMPGLKGSELIKRAGRLRPMLPILLITGFDRVRGLDELGGRVTILRKPFRREQFLAHVHALLGTTAGQASKEAVLL